MKVGDLVRYKSLNGYDMDIGIIMESVQTLDGKDVVKMVLWPDGYILPHYLCNLEVISEDR